MELPEFESEVSCALQAAEAKLSAEFPHVKFVYSHEEVNWSNTYVLSAFFYDNPSRDESELLQLCVVAFNVAEPTVQADVVWGHPSGVVDVTYLDAAVPLSLENLSRITGVGRETRASEPASPCKISWKVACATPCLPRDGD